MHFSARLDWGPAPPFFSKFFIFQVPGEYLAQRSLDLWSLSKCFTATGLKIGSDLWGFLIWDAQGALPSRRLSTCLPKREELPMWQGLTLPCSHWEGKLKSTCFYAVIVKLLSLRTVETESRPGFWWAAWSLLASFWISHLQYTCKWGGCSIVDFALCPGFWNPACKPELSIPYWNPKQMVSAEGAKRGWLESMLEWLSRLESQVAKSDIP